MSESAIITDFDGTLVHLEIDWAALRHRVNVQRISELWTQAPTGTGGPWTDVAEMEVYAALTGARNAELIADAMTYDSWAILTNNSEAAVHALLSTIDDLDRMPVIIAREDLRGPKEQFDVFSRGCMLISQALEMPAPARYVGDAEYELEFARRLGHHAELAEWKTPPTGPRRGDVA